MLGTLPSDLITFFDFNRFAELLVDGQEVVPATTAELDLNTRAIQIVGAAEFDVLEAVRTKQHYTIQQLKDMIIDFHNGGQYGVQLLKIIADLAWGHANLRKRYSKDTPQGQDQGFDLGEKTLKALSDGEKIFVISGMNQTDGNGNVIGTYGEQIPNAGLVSGSSIRTDVGRPPGLWGSIPLNKWRYFDW